MSSVRASTRVGISWDGGEFFEDTDTLVLTINDFSLDLRVFNAGPNAGQTDWSTVAKVTEAEGSTAEKPSLRWDHIIDSRPPTDMPDQGVFANLPNGDVTETGIMYNPKTGQYQDYVEIWRRYPLEKGGPYCVLERVEPSEAGQAFLGRVGSHSLGLEKTSDGVFSAWREDLSENGAKRVYEEGDTSRIPSLSTGLEACQTGDEVTISGIQWRVRTAGIL